MNFDFRGVATGNAIAERSHQNHVSPGAPPHTMENSPLRTGESYASIIATGRQDVESRSPPEGTAGRTGPVAATRGGTMEFAIWAPRMLSVLRIMAALLFICISLNLT